jgi:hypothetical protein
MDDRTILQTITTLVDEEHALLDKGPRNELDDGDRQRIDEIEVMLDQCWDLLRQRRARREFGQDPDTAEPRSPAVVERYEQ